MDDERTKLEKANRDIADMLRQAVPSGVGFALLVFTLGPGGFMTWASNARRDDMVKALRELIERFETGTAATKGEA